MEAETRRSWIVAMFGIGFPISGVPKFEPNTEMQICSGAIQSVWHEQAGKEDVKKPAESNGLLVLMVLIPINSKFKSVGTTTCCPTCWNNQALVQLLLESHADLQIANDRGDTPEDLARACGYSDLLPILSTFAV